MRAVPVIHRVRVDALLVAARARVRGFVLRQGGAAAQHGCQRGDASERPHRSRHDFTSGKRFSASRCRSAARDSMPSWILLMLLRFPASTAGRQQQRSRAGAPRPIEFRGALAQGGGGRPIRWKLRSWLLALVAATMVPCLAVLGGTFAASAQRDKQEARRTAHGIALLIAGRADQELTE